MEMSNLTAAKLGASGLLTVATAWWLDVAHLFILFVCFVALDCISAILATWKRGEKLSGEIARQGVIKKSTSFTIILLGMLIDMIISTNPTFTEFSNGIWGGYASMLCLYQVMLNEAISIIRHSEEVGVQIPFLSTLVKKIQELIAKLQKQKEGGE